MSLFNNSIFLLNDGSVMGCGDSTNYQLFISNSIVRNPIKLNIENVVHFFTGVDYVMFLLNDGTVKACGENSNGQLGLGNTSKRIVPTLIPNLNNVKEITYIDIILKYFMKNNHERFVYKDGLKTILTVDDLKDNGLTLEEITEQYLEKEKTKDTRIGKLEID